MRFTSPFRLIAAALFSLALAACSSESGPENGIAGTWEATELVLSVEGEDTDLLDEGGELRLVLTDAGTTTGTFTVPGAYTESGQDETQSLAGTYAYDDGTGTATFDHDADTFIRDVLWTVDGDEMRGVFTGGDASISATLEWRP